MTRARKLLTTALAAAVLCVGLVVANAATLNLADGSLGAAVIAHPCAGTLAATTPPTSIPVSTVTITPPAACVGRTVAVTVVAGAVQRQGTATAPASGTVTVTLDGSYSPSTTTQVAAVVDGWNLPTGWTYTPPATGVIVAGNRDTELTVGDWFTSGTLTCVRVAPFVTEGNKTWRINVNTASAPFDGAAPVFTGQDAGKVTTIGAPAGGWQLVGGIPPWDKLQQIQDVPLVFNICG